MKVTKISVGDYVKFNDGSQFGRVVGTTLAGASRVDVEMADGEVIKNVADAVLDTGLPMRGAA